MSRRQRVPVGAADDTNIAIVVTVHGRLRQWYSWNSTRRAEARGRTMGRSGGGTGGSNLGSTINEGH